MISRFLDKIAYFFTSLSDKIPCTRAKIADLWYNGSKFFIEMRVNFERRK